MHLSLYVYLSPGIDREKFIGFPQLPVVLDPGYPQAFLHSGSNSGVGNNNCR